VEAGRFTYHVAGCPLRVRPLWGAAMNGVEWARVVQPKTGAGWWHRMSDTRIPACGVFLDLEDDLDRTTMPEDMAPDGEVCPRCRYDEQWEYES
jgi:hypothetical protein